MRRRAGTIAGIGIRSIITVLLIVILLSSANSYFNLKLFSGQIGGLGYPTNPFYNPSFGSISYNIQSPTNRGSFPWAIGTSGPVGSATNVYAVNQGTLTIPIGMFGDSFSFSNNAGLGTGSQPLAYWRLKLPGGIADICTGYGQPTPCPAVSGFDLTGTIVGANGGILLTSASPVGDPTCTNYGPGSPDRTNTPSNTCWAADYATVQAAQAINPPCILGVTVCVTSSSITATSNTTITNPRVNGIQYNGTFVQQGTQVTSQTWYIYRLITSLTLQIVPPAIVPQCVLTGNNPWGGTTPTCSNLGSGSPVICGGFGSTCNADPTVQNAINNMVTSEINKVDVLTNARISFGLNVVGFGGLTCSSQEVGSGNCWYGIVGVWIGGQGMQTAGCTGSSTCSFVQGPHTQLPIFQDSELSNPAAVPPVDQLVNLASITNKTVASVTAANTYSQVYTYVDAKSLGVQYSYAGNSQCSSTQLATCIITPVPIVVNIPIVYDIIGSKSLATWLYKYPGIPPNGGTSAGFISGQVLDGSNKNILGTYQPFVGACVGIGGVCSGSSGQLQAQTDQNGKYTISNIPAGTYSVYISSPGYSPFFQPNVQVSVGSTTTLNTILFQPPNPAAGLACLIPPVSIPNPVPFQAPITSPGILCVPNWVLPAVMILAALGLVAFIFTTPGGSALGIAGGALIQSRSRRR